MNRLLFVIFSVALVGFLTLAVWHDYDREWRRYQQAFYRLEPAEWLSRDKEATPRAPAQSLPRQVAIKQTVVDALERVDRCETCHLGINNAAFANAPQPYTTHPGDYLAHHPTEQFACTTCHWGQGYSTTAKAAHGDIKHWDEPMLRGPYIQASCGKCHLGVQRLPGAEVLARGRVLFKEMGCVGCHTLRGEGGPISVDLTEIGSKTADELDFTFVEGEHTVANWMYKHFLDPQQVTPGFPEQGIPPSVMPNYRMTAEEAAALTTYMMSLTKERLTREYIVQAPSEPEPAPVPVHVSSVERGRAVFERFGCIGCHNVDGRGGRKNWNAYTSGEVPALVYVGQAYTREALKEKIQRGVPIVARRDPSALTPPLYMPAWGEKIKGQDLEDLVDYLMSLMPQEGTKTSSPLVPEPAPVAPAQQQSRVLSELDELVDQLITLVVSEAESCPPPQRASRSTRG